MESKEFKRKILVIDRHFQYKLISTFLFSILGSLIIFTAVVAGYYWLSSMSGENLFKEFITIHKQVAEDMVVEENGVKKTATIYKTIADNNFQLAIFHKSWQKIYI